MKNQLLFCFLFSLLSFASQAQATLSGQVSHLETNEPLELANIQIANKTIHSDLSGKFVFTDLPFGEYQLIAFLPGYKTQEIKIQLQEESTILKIYLEPYLLNLETVEVTSDKTGDINLHRLRNVEGLAIYAGRKTEVVELSNMIANLATNNPRQIYQGIAGLNIWENDGSGLQLNIGARGLNPNRTSNFNTRQNGYDISADALGYPESYYTPPSLALERIEIVRGAASLQYGPQFGGLLNFIFKEGPKDKTIQFTTQNTVGSFGLINSFNSLGGTVKGWNYYTFYQGKKGNGWRPNSQFTQHTAYAAIKKDFGNFKIGLEYTFMDYLAQQPGGLQDFEFALTPRASKRSRNWFDVNWNLAALKMEYRFTEETKIDNRTFYLHAKRNALGELGPINRPDPFRERDLIMGGYENIGNETRIIHRYTIGKKLSTFLAGARYYKGLTNNRQGDASDGLGPDFKFLNPIDLERSDYTFPSQNISLFTENLFNIGSWNITPGIRYEYIKTASEGYYKERVFSGGQVIFEQKLTNSKINDRGFVLGGLGIGYQLNDQIDLYGNFSQNYRSINFSDLAVANPNIIIDSLLQDERGFNADLGFRGESLEGVFHFDISVFLLNYQNRIGLAEISIADPILIEKVVAFRTNIGNAQIIGFESYVEADIWKLLRPEATRFSLRTTINLSFLKGHYTAGLSAFQGNDVELIPPISLKAGLILGWHNFHMSYLLSHVGAHFSDATNAEFVSDATRGIIPSYTVQDLSFSYAWKWLQLQTGLNNLADAMYFTRRSTAYPGPGIIPADGRSWYISVGLTF